MKYEIARPSLRNIDPSSNLIPVGVQITTLALRGVPSEVVLNGQNGMKSPCAVNLHNAESFILTQGENERIMAPPVPCRSKN
jgi:hypothetical protein